MEKDFVSSSFFSDNERYADIINGIGCDGVPFVKGKDLKEMDTRVNFGTGFARRMSGRRTVYRDLLRRTPFGVNFAIVGIENQEEIDYALPLRIMSQESTRDRHPGYGRKSERNTRVCRKGNICTDLKRTAVCSPL